MSFGLPTHLARGVTSRALANASQGGGLACLIAALVTVLLTMLPTTVPGAGVGAGPDRARAAVDLWPTVLALLPMMALLLILRRMNTVLVTALYLIVGALCTLLYTLTMLTRAPAFHDTGLFIVALPVIAMVAVGGIGSVAVAGVLWSTAGFVLAQAAVFGAAMIAGRAFVPDVTSVLVYVLLVSLRFLEAGVGRARHTPQAMIHRAVRDAHLWQVRHELAVQFAADLHDEVLSDLIAIGSSKPGALPARLRRGIERDLGELGRDPAGHGQPGPGPADPDGADGGGWPASGVHHAVEQTREDGLSVRVSGDPRLLAPLSPEQDRVLGLAVRQCLVNVLRHAETREADVAISGASDQVSIMVVDAGRGFVPEASVAERAADSGRLGLRTSVRQRIEGLGGTVTIWSSPGVGTTVLMEIGLADASASPQRVATSLDEVGT